MYEYKVPWFGDFASFGNFFLGVLSKRKMLKYRPKADAKRLKVAAGSL